VLNDPDAVGVLLRDSILGGRPVRSIPVPGGAEQALTIACGPDEVLMAWQSARAVLEQTERWPVVGWGVDLFNRFPFDHGTGGDTSVGGILDRADRMDAGEIIADLASADDADYAYDELEPYELMSTRRLVGDAPSSDEVRHALGSQLTHGRLDRWLLDWEEARGPHRSEPPTHLEWFEPRGMDVAVVLLPTVNGWHTPAYMSFFGAEGPGGAEKLIAVLRSWSQRYGAELVAHYGTMLEFVVTRPPETVQEAWQLAREHELIAPGTTLLPGVPLREHARALVGRSTWFLQERP
jgi:hypothetical protein